MKAIILAAGRGSRLNALTTDKPKSLVELHQQPLIENQLEVLRRHNLSDIGLVTGYLGHCFEKYNLQTFHNPDFETSNMVYSLMAAEKWFDGTDDILISYGDIVYTETVLATVIASKANIAVTADTNWFDLWSLRMPDPLSDAESFIYNTRTRRVSELGKRIHSREQAMAQYIGLTKISADAAVAVAEAYRNLDATMRRHMYMTDFIQHLINLNFDVRAALIERGWLEVDSVEDLDCYHQLGLEKALGVVSHR